MLVLFDDGCEALQILLAAWCGSLQRFFDVVKEELLSVVAERIKDNHFASLKDSALIGSFKYL